MALCNSGAAYLESSRRDHGPGAFGCLWCTALQRVNYRFG
jgi:hypothetical protein